MLTDEQRKARELFLPIAIVEHHQIKEPTIDVYDICEGLGSIWIEIQEQAAARVFKLDSECVQAVNDRIAKAFNIEPAAFRNEEKWLEELEELEELGCIEYGEVIDEPGHTFSWIFSSLYWNHLTQFRLATTWVFINALRIQSGHSAYRLKLERLGEFLNSLSGSGPPIYDGQTFIPEKYST